MSHYLVTGGAGFIGSHLVDRLLADGHLVTVVDDFSSSVWTLDEFNRLPQYFESRHRTRRLVVYDQSVSDFANLRSNVALSGIFHLASRVGPAGILPYAGDMVKTITDDVYQMIDLATWCGCRLLYVSTSEVYGGVRLNKGLSETDPCIVDAKVTARLEYAVAKLAAEVAVLNTLQRTKLDAVIIRPFNVAGARQGVKGGFVLPRFVQQALAGEPLTVFGTGEQQRAFTHVSDIVDGLVKAFLHGGRGEVYNLGNPHNRTTILNLAGEVLSRVPGSLRFIDGQSVYGPLYAEAADKWPNAGKAMNDLGWMPICGIGQTVDDVIAYEKTRLKA